MKAVVNAELKVIGRDELNIVFAEGPWNQLQEGHRDIKFD
jgi:hypothetical protein